MGQNHYQAIMAEAEKLLKVNPGRRELYILAWLGAFAALYNLHWPAGPEQNLDETM